ncbi:MAG: iron ABC transporter permease [Verrucomicrobia bacterium]|nr:iron ABC transporter permease [Verrucomicrobiota bacterium]MCG2681873.1 iron ABC transporter permease [Kiritimatiellia bacterium]MBU4247973.1 iron ABC transporter permease [Verrucomicrobiota bacterium]MBU4291790.1 iron ABC transporter permease [Verrucomicrobiota bacterium]MBU4430109.1 iron ABC transporter permease [Verrucomicrobiota bacterium]
MKQPFIVWLLLLLTPLVLGACLLAGATGVSALDWHTTTGQAIFWLRVHRVAAGFIIGAGLSCSGVVLQALLRNPLADPYVLGVSSGAGLGAALAIVSGIAAAGAGVLPLSAFLAAISTLGIVVLLARHGGASSIYGLLLSGVIVSSMCSSILMLIISLAPVEGLHNIMWWMLGSLQIVSSSLLLISGALIALGIFGIWGLARDLNALTLGHEMAHHLGIRTGVAITLGLALATLTTAAAVGLAGLIGFVGLIVPHLMRSLVGPDHRRLVPAAALAGGWFLALCDALARTVLAPVEIPVGVITALIGGPFFLFLLRKRRQHGWLE